MKLLLDQNLSFKLCHRLADIFPDSAHVHLVGLERASDRAIWEYAQAHGYAIVTQDADFFDIAALYGHPPKIVWLRCGNQSVDSIERLLRRHAGEVLRLSEDPAIACLEIYP